MIYTRFMCIIYVNICIEVIIMGNLTISVSDSDKQQFSDFCDQVGISSSSLLNVFIKTVIREGKIPFEISLRKNKEEERFRPNRKTIKAMKEGDALIAAEDVPGYSVEEALAELKR